MKDRIREFLMQKIYINKNLFLVGLDIDASICDAFTLHMMRQK